VVSHTTQMPCSKCGYAYSRSNNTNRARDGKSVRRRRVCLKCGADFVTYEIRAEEFNLLQALRKAIK
jgi:transcriptional regulator NrdR family protein